MGILERKQREFARRERDILDAALNLFDSDDWLSVTVEQIANAAEIGKGTIYKHFPSKEAIYARLTLDFYGALLSHLRSADTEQGSMETFRQVARFALRYHLDHAKFRRVVQYCKRGDFKNRAAPELLQGFAKLDALFDEFSTALIQRGIDEGVFADRPVEQVRYGLHATFEGAIYTLWEGYCWGKDIETDAFVEASVEFMLAGLRAVPETEPEVTG
ncbi:MAG: TetR/AcrR family transcriptional regulator [Gammaproteobacteria bacterium]|nr:TetR/AcrR family transcriptional regulator [Gammaproteobacteria bacterium]MDJ0890471.1 TetR/AcrR family transcriptional regulator [Gammaproteobacteria bacterium]